MNIFQSLNQGDASLKEPHLTSMLFYLFKESKIEFPNNSFIDFFIRKYVSIFPTTCDCEFDIDSDIKIEEILQNDIYRRDLDISIFLRQNGELKIINIENKINNKSYQQDQIQEQNNLLLYSYANSEIQNILILPYISNLNISEINNFKTIYWYSEENSLLDLISEYINSLLIDSNLKHNFYIFFKSYLNFMDSFKNIIEQDRLSERNIKRGIKNTYRFSMYEYLSNISENWEVYFQNPENVTVSQLIEKFSHLVETDLEEDYPENYQDMIDKFERGALEAQPKIMTINEKNRIHFNVLSPDEKRIFYYPDSPYGNYINRWKDMRIKPLRLMNEDNQYYTYWKNNITNEIEISEYN
jgi:hypothetical protein